MGQSARFFGGCPLFPCTFSCSVVNIISFYRQRFKEQRLFHETLSGEYQYFLGWKQKLENEGIEVSCFSPSGKKLRGGKGFVAHRRGESPIRKLVEMIPFLFQARQSLFSKRWDVVHLFLPSASFLWMIRFFPKKIRSNGLYITCLGERPHVSPQKFIFGPIKDWFFLFIRLLLGMAPRGPFDGAGYFVGTNGERNRLMSDGCPPEKVCVVLPPLVREDTPDSFSISLAESMKQKPSILYIGHFLPPKGVEDLLRAFSHIKNNEVRLVLGWSGLGDPEAILRLAKELRINDRIEIVDRLVHKAELMKTAVGLVLPFRSTSGQVSPPLVLLEAFEVGVPIIVPSWSCWGDLCIQNQTAFCYPPLDVNSLTIAMGQLLSHSFERREQMKRNQRHLMRTKSLRSAKDLYISLESHG